MYMYVCVYIIDVCLILFPYLYFPFESFNIFDIDELVEAIQQHHSIEDIIQQFIEIFIRTMIQTTGKD